LEGRGVPVLGAALDRGAAGIRQPQKLRGLVECLADRVVARTADAAILADLFHRHELRMAAGYEEEQKRKVELVREPGGQRMRFEMVDGNQRLADDEGDRLRGGEPDDHAADQARSGRSGDAVEPREIGT